jgi:hypothetical protein
VGQLQVENDVYTGRVTAVGVHFDGVGKLASEFPALSFTLPTPGAVQAPGRPSNLTACAFSSYNQAVAMQNWRGLAAAHNVVGASVRTAFDVDATCSQVALVSRLVSCCPQRTAAVAGFVADLVVLG